jgi:hypothetical protein
LLQLDSSVDVFLQSLGLEKYLITFQAEEVWKCLFFFFLYYRYVYLHIIFRSFLLIINMLLSVQVDMTALVHMTDEDLKALGIPMVNSSWSLGQDMHIFCGWFFLLKSLVVLDVLNYWNGCFLNNLHNTLCH